MLGQRPLWGGPGPRPLGWNVFPRWDDKPTFRHGLNHITSPILHATDEQPPTLCFHDSDHVPNLPRCVLTVNVKPVSRLGNDMAPKNCHLGQLDRFAETGRWLKSRCHRASTPSQAPKSGGAAGCHSSHRCPERGACFLSAGELTCGTPHGRGGLAPGSRGGRLQPDAVVSLGRTRGNDVWRKRRRQIGPDRRRAVVGQVIRVLQRAAAPG